MTIDHIKDYSKNKKLQIMNDMTSNSQIFLKPRFVSTHIQCLPYFHKEIYMIKLVNSFANRDFGNESAFIYETFRDFFPIPICLR